MSADAALIVGWGRSPVAPVGGALQGCAPHQLAGPVARGVLARAGIPSSAVDAVVLGNALGAGGNPARMVALEVGLPDACAAVSVDSQCCAGLDAIAMACGLLATGQASVVLAGGVEAWSRAPIRQHRPLDRADVPVVFERPAFAPDPARDPDLLAAAAHYAQAHGMTRAAQDAYAVESHARAVAAENAAVWQQEIVPVAGLVADAYPRVLDPTRTARMPALAGQVQQVEGTELDCSVSTLGVSPRADGAGLVVLASAAACRRLGLLPRLRWRGSASVGCAPEMPLVGAALAAQRCWERSGEAGALADPEALQVLELHDAFAVQGLAFAQALGIDPARLNVRGGGLARGHPIGASGAIALVRVLTELARCPSSALPSLSGVRGLAAIAGAGGLGAAVLVERFR